MNTAVEKNIGFPAPDLVTSALSGMYAHLQDVIDAEIEYSVRNNARPKIRGRIFNAKLERNNIRLVVQATPSDTRIWIEQYGLRISRVININEEIYRYESSSIAG